jgi:hypothetical protein
MELSRGKTATDKQPALMYNQSEREQSPHQRRVQARCVLLQEPGKSIGWEGLDE